MPKSKTKKFSSYDLACKPSDYMESFRYNIRMLSEREGISLSMISEFSDIPIETLKSFLYGDSKDCHLATAIKLARIFKISVDELVGCGTIDADARESLALLREMPHRFTHFIRWIIRKNYKRPTDEELLLPNCEYKYIQSVIKEKI